MLVWFLHEEDSNMGLDVQEIYLGRHWGGKMGRELGVGLTFDRKKQRDKG